MISVVDSMTVVMTFFVLWSIWIPRTTNVERKVEKKKMMMMIEMHYCHVSIIE